MSQQTHTHTHRLSATHPDNQKNIRGGVGDGEGAGSAQGRDVYARHMTCDHALRLLGVQVEVERLRDLQKFNKQMKLYLASSCKNKA